MKNGIFFLLFALCLGSILQAQVVRYTKGHDVIFAQTMDTTAIEHWVDQAESLDVYGTRGTLLCSYWPKERELVLPVGVTLDEVYADTLVREWMRPLFNVAKAWGTWRRYADYLPAQAMTTDTMVAWNAKAYSRVLPNIFHFNGKTLMAWYEQPEYMYSSTVDETEYIRPTLKKVLGYELRDEGIELAWVNSRHDVVLATRGKDKKDLLMHLYNQVLDVMHGIQNHPLLTNTVSMHWFADFETGVEKQVLFLPFNLWEFDVSELTQNEDAYAWRWVHPIDVIFALYDIDPVGERYADLTNKDFDAEHLGDWVWLERQVRGRPVQPIWAMDPIKEVSSVGVESIGGPHQRVRVESE